MSEKSTLYTANEIRAKALSVTISAGVLLVVLMVFSGWSFGWFTRKTDVFANAGISVEAREIDAELKVYLNEEEIATDSSIFPLSNLKPSDTIRFDITITNKADSANNYLQLILSDIAGETPYTVTNATETTYYWFSSQFRITSVTTSAKGANSTVTIPDTLSGIDIENGGTGVYLFAPSDMFDKDGNMIQVGTQDSLSAPSDIKISDLSLGSGESATVSITVEFYNSQNLNQDVYKSFGTIPEGETETKGSFSRVFRITY